MDFIVNERIAETIEILKNYGKSDLREIGLDEKAAMTFNTKNNHLRIITDLEPLIKKLKKLKSSFILIGITLSK